MQHLAEKQASAGVPAGQAPKAKKGSGRDLRVATALLTEFAHRGFARTSMASLAEAIGVTRQTVYNRFGNKDGVIDWAIAVQVRTLRARAMRCLEDQSVETEEALLNAFCAWLGPAVPLVRQGSYGEELLGLGNAARRRSPSSPLDAFADELSTALLERGVGQSKQAASDIAFLLMMAAKGLRPETGTEAEFREGRARAIRGAGGTGKKSSRRGQ